MSTRIKQHPDPATLLSFAAGVLSEPLAAAVAAHVSMCAGCRNELADMELMGAALLGASTPVLGDGVAAPSRPREMAPTTGGLHVGRATNDKLPAPIALKYGLTLDTIPWKRLGSGIWQHRLRLSPGTKGDLRLFKLAAGAKLPAHGHGGSELTLVLDGVVIDGTGRYYAGDLQELDAEIEHQPVADKTLGCICLVASEGAPRLKGFRGLMLRLLHLWRRRSRTDQTYVNELSDH
jgi:putative transcriptional regulator